MTEDGLQEVIKAPRKRGRPKGSKNKPKLEVSEGAGAPHSPSVSQKRPVAMEDSPAPLLGTAAAGVELLKLIAERWPNAKYTNLQQVKNTMVYAGRNAKLWQILTWGRK